MVIKNDIIVIVNINITTILLLFLLLLLVLSSYLLLSPCYGVIASNGSNKRTKKRKKYRMFASKFKKKKKGILVAPIFMCEGKTKKKRWSLFYHFRSRCLVSSKKKTKNIPGMISKLMAIHDLPFQAFLFTWC